MFFFSLFLAVAAIFGTDVTAGTSTAHATQAVNSTVSVVGMSESSLSSYAG